MMLCRTGDWSIVAGSWRHPEVVELQEENGRSPPITRAQARRQGRGEGGVTSTSCIVTANVVNDANSGMACGASPSIVSPAVLELLQLPQIPEPRRRKRRVDLLVDYTKSLLLTSEDYVNAMQMKGSSYETRCLQKQPSSTDSNLARKKIGLESAFPPSTPPPWVHRCDLRYQIEIADLPQATTSPP